jgi:hypothetical protein
LEKSDRVHPEGLVKLEEQNPTSIAALTVGFELSLKRPQLLFINIADHPLKDQQHVFQRARYHSLVVLLPKGLALNRP